MLMPRRTALVAPAFILILSLGCSYNAQKKKEYYLKSAQQYLSQDKYSEATIQLRKALQIDPTFPEAYRLLGNAYGHLHQWKDAVSALSMATELDSNDVPTHLSLAEAYLNAEDPASARKEAELVLERDTQNASAYQIQGAAYIAEGQKERALQAFQRIAQLRPEDASSWVNLAVIDIGLQKPGEAEQQLLRARSIAPHSPLAYLNLARLYRQEGKVDAAEAVLWEGKKNCLDSPEIYIELADTLYGEHKDQLGDAVIALLRNQPWNSSESESAVGDLYGALRRFELARTAYQRAVEKSPKDLDAKLKLVDADLNGGNLKDATVWNDRILKEEPDNVGSRLARGRILLAEGYQDQALNEFREQVVKAPNSPQAHYFLGQVYHDKGDLSQAEIEYRRAIELDPKLLIALQSLSQLLLARGEPGAVEPASQCVGLRPLDPAERLLLGTAYLHNGDVQKARQQFLFAIEFDPRNATAQFDLGLCSIREHKLEQADKELRLALEISPEFIPALNELADVQLELRRPAQAVELLVQYLKTHPDDAKAHLIFGSIYRKTNDFDRAKQEFERAIQIDPNFLSAYLSLGEVYQHTGETDLAIRRYEHAITLQPQFAPLITLVGNLYLDNGDLENAKRYYQRALAVRPDFALAANNLAWVYAEQGVNLDSAFDLASRARQQLPGMESITDTLGWVLYKRGQYSVALPLFEECVQTVPDQPAYRYHLAMTLIAQGEIKRGREELESALRHELAAGDADQARRTLARLQ